MFLEGTILQSDLYLFNFYFEHIEHNLFLRILSLSVINGIGLQYGGSSGKHIL